MTSSALVPSASTDRTAEVSRNTAETRITVRLNLDGTGQASLHTGIGFFDHMLEQIARHGLIDLEVHADGDLHIDGHHTVEDVGITIGQAFARAVGDKKGIRRYGHAYVPLDEALSRVVIDLSGRPGLHMDVDMVAFTGSTEVGRIIRRQIAGWVTPSSRPISAALSVASPANSRRMARSVASGVTGPLISAAPAHP